MSRVGNKPIKMGDKVDVTLSDRTVTVKGPKGELSWDVPEGVDVRVVENEIRVAQPDDGAADSATYGLVRSLLQNFVVGVTEGFRKQLEIQGIGYRGQCQGSRLVLNLGFSHPVEYQVPEGIDVSMPNQTTIVVEGIDKQLVGQTAATIRAFRPPDNYKGKGVRYTGEYVPLKEGKTVG